jgi:hypothetical protein
MISAHIDASGNTRFQNHSFIKTSSLHIFKDNHDHAEKQSGIRMSTENGRW